MTVAELIAKLSEFPSDMPVVTPGFDESGYDNIGTVKIVSIIDVGGTGHTGRYDDAEYSNGGIPGADPFDAVKINF